MVEKGLLSLNISKNDVQSIIATIENDVEFLKELKFMDYSLLLGIEKVNNAGETTTEENFSINR